MASSSAAWIPFALLSIQLPVDVLEKVVENGLSAWAPVTYVEDHCRVPGSFFSLAQNLAALELERLSRKWKSSLSHRPPHHQPWFHVCMPPSVCLFAFQVSKSWVKGHVTNPYFLGLYFVARTLVFVINL